MVRKYHRFILIFLTVASFTLPWVKGSEVAAITYSYDTLNRLTKVVYDNGTTEEYTYDAAGNRLTKIVTLAPTVTTDSASNITHTSAALNGTVNPNGASTTVVFEWGTTTSYGNTATASQSPLTGATSQEVTVNLTGLSSETTYHVRVSAANSQGTAYGNDISFTTATTTTTTTSTTTTTTSTTTSTTTTSTTSVTTTTSTTTTTTSTTTSTTLPPLPPCPECFGSPVVLTNVTFNSGTACECSDSSSVTIGSGVTIKSGATVIFKAPTVKLQNGFHAERGAVVRIKQE